MFGCAVAATVHLAQHIIALEDACEWVCLLLCMLLLLWCLLLAWWHPVGAARVRERESTGDVLMVCAGAVHAVLRLMLVCTCMLLYMCMSVCINV